MRVCSSAAVAALVTAVAQVLWGRRVPAASSGPGPVPGLGPIAPLGKGWAREPEGHQPLPAPLPPRAQRPSHAAGVHGAAAQLQRDMRRAGGEGRHEAPHAAIVQGHVQPRRPEIDSLTGAVSWQPHPLQEWHAPPLTTSSSEGLLATAPGSMPHDSRLSCQPAVQGGAAPAAAHTLAAAAAEPPVHVATPAPGHARPFTCPECGLSDVLTPVQVLQHRRTHM
jgi:hypothetical protein